MMRLLCRYLKHVPDKTRVWNDNVDFRAPCKRCGLMLVRDRQRGWRPYDDALDHATFRKAHRRDDTPLP